MLGSYLLALGLTLGIEGGVAYILGLRTRRQLLAVAAINVLTHVLLNYLLLVLGYLGFETPLVLVVALEILVILAEWRLLLYALDVSTGRFLAISALGNAASFLVGLLIFGW